MKNKQLEYILLRLRDVVTIRPLRKFIMRILMMSAHKKMISELEETFPSNTVLIFQCSFFDQDGKQCFNGGGERYVRDLAKLLAEAGKTPIVIQQGNKKLWERKIDDVRIVGLPISGSFATYTYCIQMFKKYDFVVYSMLVDFGKKLHPNIFIGHGIWWDGYDMCQLPRRYQKSLLSGIDNFISVDTNTISFYRTEYGHIFKNVNVRYIPNYVDLSEYKPGVKKDDKIHVLFPRRATPERGFFETLRIARKIFGMRNDVVFDFVGFLVTNKIKIAMESLKSEFPDNVTHQLLEPDEMSAVYQNADITLIPTQYSEGTSLSCLEAMASGNAIVATNIGGLPNLIIDGYNGIMINPDEDELFFATDKLINNTVLRNELSKNALSVVKAFSKDRWANKWRAIIQNMPRKKRLVGITIIRNESKNFLRPWLENMRGHLDYHVFLDDASDDDTPDIIQAAIDAGYPGELHRRKTSLFLENEPKLRAELWEHARKVCVDGDWVLIVDADEFYGSDLTSFMCKKALRRIKKNIVSVRCCDMWDREHYRVDGVWNYTKAPRLIRFIDTPFGDRAAEFHSPAYPNIYVKMKLHETKIKMVHLAYLRDTDKQRRYDRYTQNAPNEGMLKHAKSILEVTPKLKKLKTSILENIE